VNDVQRRLRDDFLTHEIRQAERIDFSSYEGFCILWEWARKQNWWGSSIFDKYLRKYRGDIRNAICYLLKGDNLKNINKGKSKGYS
jgi:hypothetical protein